jgi:hypothetical protein
VLCTWQTNKNSLQQTQIHCYLDRGLLFGRLVSILPFVSDTLSTTFRCEMYDSSWIAIQDDQKELGKLYLKCSLNLTDWPIFGFTKVPIIRLCCAFSSLTFVKCFSCFIFIWLASSMLLFWLFNHRGPSIWKELKTWSFWCLLLLSK